jgi:hypothetical protein
MQPQPMPFGDLIRINDASSSSRIIAFDSREVIMSFDTMLVSAAVVFMFLAFAGVLRWRDIQTRPGRPSTDSRPQRRRSF